MSKSTVNQRFVVTIDVEYLVQDPVAQTVGEDGVGVHTDVMSSRYLLLDAKLSNMNFDLPGISTDGVTWTVSG